ncbi:MAG: hypothetical protein LBC73_08190, partial [Oscillospiraceae bacterium]|nr:hypothetical protein [Oscillospiraceae bacterium]
MNEKSESKHALLSIKVIVCSLLFVPIWFFLYAFLHEAGHALVGLAYGGSIVNFVFWNFNAHVVINGAEYTAFGLALFHVAGLLLPILVYILALCFYNPKRKPVLYHICYIIATVSLIWSLASWVVMSFMSIFTILPGEDVWKFIDSTGFHPLLVT